VRSLLSEAESHADRQGEAHHQADHGSHDPLLTLVELADPNTPNHYEGTPDVEKGELDDWASKFEGVIPWELLGLKQDAFTPVVPTPEAKKLIDDEFVKWMNQLPSKRNPSQVGSRVSAKRSRGKCRGDNQNPPKKGGENPATCKRNDKWRAYSKVQNLYRKSPRQETHKRNLA